MSQLNWKDYDANNPPPNGWYVVLVEYDDGGYYIAIGVIGSQHVGWFVDTYDIQELEVKYKVLRYAAIDNVPDEVKSD